MNFVINNFKLIVNVIRDISISIVSIFLFFIAKKHYQVLEKYEQTIEKIEDEIDSLPGKVLTKTRNSLVNQSQLDRMIEKELKPLKRKLERLKQKRIFIKEKFSIFGFFKK